MIGTDDWHVYLNETKSIISAPLDVRGKSPLGGEQHRLTTVNGKTPSLLYYYCAARLYQSRAVYYGHVLFDPNELAYINSFGILLNQLS